MPTLDKVSVIIGSRDKVPVHREVVNTLAFGL